MLFGAFLVLVGIAGLATVWIHVQWEAVWPLVLIGLGAALVFVATRQGVDAHHDRSVLPATDDR